MIERRRRNHRRRHRHLACLSLRDRGRNASWKLGRRWTGREGFGGIGRTGGMLGELILVVVVLVLFVLVLGGLGVARQYAPIRLSVRLLALVPSRVM